MTHSRECWLKIGENMKYAGERRNCTCGCFAVVDALKKAHLAWVRGDVYLPDCGIDAECKAALKMVSLPK